jgi:Membrane domain of glycerophosphoryl diester phosphodiesterase
MARWQPQGNNRPSASRIQPRYRRLLTVGALLDESIQLFRQHWITLALFGLVALVPSWLLLTAMYASGLQLGFISTAVETDSFATFPFLDLAMLLGVSLLSGVFGLLWTAASTAAADSYVHGERPTLASVYARAVRCFPALLGGILLYILVVLGLSIAATALFVITVFGVLGTLVAAIGLIYWWRTPAGRQRWLKWLIILTAPFGVLTYFIVRWSLFLPAVVVEGHGPLSSLRRSRRLTERQFFRSFAVLTLASVIVVVLVSVPVSLVDIVFNLVMRTSDLEAYQQRLQVLNSTVSSICQVLFSSIGTITYVLLFIDLRNRREGTDLGERIGLLEAATA